MLTIDEKEDLMNEFRLQLIDLRKHLEETKEKIEENMNEEWFDYDQNTRRTLRDIENLLDDLDNI